jgi:capreomycidine synthase
MTMPSYPPALLEEWMREFYFRAEIDIGSSGVEDFGFAELRALLGIGVEDLDRLVFHDSETLGGQGIREALAHRWTADDPARVMVTHGSSEANFLVMTALLQRGDEVLTLSPCYQQLHTVAEVIGCRVRQWSLRGEHQFHVDIQELRAQLQPRTRMVVVNLPHNPTGVSVTLEEQRALIEAVADTGAYLVWDGAFADITYDLPRLPDPTRFYDRAISLGTLSKSYGLPGLRVGWCLAHPDVLAKLVRVRDYVTLHLSPLVEFVARRVIEEADLMLAQRLALASRNRQLVAAWAGGHGDRVHWTPPMGGVCGFPWLPEISDTEAFCRRLAEEHRVLLVPGECFGRPGHVRLGFGRDTEVLRTGLSRLSDALHTYRPSQAAAPGQRPRTTQSAAPRA